MNPYLLGYQPALGWGSSPIVQQGDLLGFQGSGAPIHRYEGPYADMGRDMLGFIVGMQQGGGYYDGMVEDFRAGLEPYSEKER